MSDLFSIFGTKKEETRLVAWWKDTAADVEKALVDARHVNVRVVHDPASSGQVVDDMATGKVLANCYIIGQPGEIVEAITALSSSGLKGLHQVVAFDEDRFWNRIVSRQNMLLPAAANR